MSVLGILAIIGGALLMSEASVKSYLRAIGEPMPAIAQTVALLAGIAKLVGSIGAWLLVICAITALVQWGLGYFFAPLPELR